MLILPQRGPKILRAVPRAQWREPSQRSGLNQIENRTWFACEARTSDGLLYWRGWFEDRDDADQFLWHLTRHLILGAPFAPEIRRLPVGPSYPHTFVTEGWHPSRYRGEWQSEWAELPLSYQLSTVVYLTTTSGSNQTASKPGDWTDAGSKIEGLAGGGSGAASQNGAGVGYATGGAASAFAKITDFSWTGSSATYRLEAAAAGVATAGAGEVNGTDGKDAWFNDTAFPTTGSNKIGVKAGAGGNESAPFTGPGGLASASYASGGTTAKQSGGDGGSTASNFAACGGGGAGGPNGDGVHGVDGTVDDTATNGGNGDAGSGGAGSASSTGATSSAGGNGAELGDLTKGSGGGSGGVRRTGGTATSGTGGLYGAGSGGAWSTTTTATSGNAAQGLFVMTYTPAVSDILFAQSVM